MHLVPPETKIELARAEEAQKRLKDALIPGFPGALLQLIGRHDRELLAALEGDEDDDAQPMGPSDPSAEDKGSDGQE